MVNAWFQALFDTFCPSLLWLLILLVDLINNQIVIPSPDVIQLTFTLKMTTAQVVKTSVTVNNNSSINHYVHPDDQTQPTFEIIILSYYSGHYLANISLNLEVRFNPLTYKQSHSPPWYKGGWWTPPPPGFWYVVIFRNDFAFSEKPLIFSTRWGIFYGWGRC